MFRRRKREMREYLYKKKIEDREMTKQRKRNEIRTAVDEMKTIPGNLRNEAIDVHQSLEWEDEGGEDISPDLDNEYKWAGVEEPKVIITTSRDPSVRLKNFAKEIKLIFPNSHKFNRGGYEIKDLISSAISNNASDIIILSEHRGNPTGMAICHLPYGPTAFFNISDAFLRHDIPNVKTMSEEYPLLLAAGMTSVLGKRVIQILSALFPPLKEGPKPARVIAFVSRNGQTITFRHVVMKKLEDGGIEEQEVGPRFELKLFKIIRGTLDNEDTADIEYQLTSFVRSAKFHLPLWEKGTMDWNI